MCTNTKIMVLKRLMLSNRCYRYNEIIHISRTAGIHAHIILCQCRLAPSLVQVEYHSAVLNMCFLRPHLLGRGPASPSCTPPPTTQ